MILVIYKNKINLILFIIYYMESTS